MRILVPPSLAEAAVHQLATVDYSVATRVSDAVATVVSWAYAHDAPLLARGAVYALQTMDDVGSFLISVVVWIVMHSA